MALFFRYEGRDSKRNIPTIIVVSSTKLKSLECEFALRLSESKVGPAITDLGNIILDVNFNDIEDCALLDHQLNNIPGIVEHVFGVKMRVTSQ